MTRLMTVQRWHKSSVRAGLAALLAVAVATAAAACSGSGGFEAGPLGAVEVGPGEAIQIRSVQTLSRNPGLGAPSQRGVALAIEDYGPVAGRAVSMRAGIDSECTKIGGWAAAGTAAVNPKVVGVIGPSCSVAATGLSPVIDEYGLVAISAAVVAPSLTSDLVGNPGTDHHPGFYRVSNNALYRALAAARFAYDELGLRRVAAIHDGDPYTWSTAGAFADAFGELGGQAEVLDIDKGTTDMTPVLTQAAATDSDGIFFPIFQAEGARIVQQIGQVPGLEQVELISASSLMVSEFLAVPESEGVYFAGPESDFAGTNAATGVSGDQLMAAYRERYGEAPTSIYLPRAYDATTLLLEAIEQVAVDDGGTVYIDRQKLRDALTATSGFTGIAGAYTCDEFGDCGTGRVQISHHTDSSVTDPSQLPVVYRFAP